MSLYFVFLGFLTAYILVSKYCNVKINRGVANITNELLSFNNSNMTSGMIDETRCSASQCLKYIVMLLLGLLFVGEGWQLHVYRKDYIKSNENWLELLLIVVTFTSCSGIVDSIEVNRHLFAIAILLGWFDLVLILG